MMWNVRRGVWLFSAIAVLGGCPNGGGDPPPPPEPMCPSAPTGPLVNLDDRSGIFGALGATGQTAVGAACEKDYDCFLGQTCVMQKCAATQSDDKLSGELTVDADGDYLLTVYGPADRTADAGRTDTNDAIALLFTFTPGPGRGARLLQLERREAPHADAYDIAVLHARVRAEPFLRKLERRAIAEAAPLAQGHPLTGAARQSTCSQEQFAFKGSCYAVDESFGPVKYSFGGNADVTVAVKKIVGQTAILVDTADTVAQAQIDKLAEAFDGVALKRNLEIFNKGSLHEGALDTDKNGKIGIVLSSKVGAAGNAGLFDLRDVLAAGTSVGDATANGNEADLIWAQPPGLAWGSPARTATFESVIGTLAHEYQHVINFHRSKQKGGEALFLNEGLSHLAEDLTGYGASNLPAVSAFLENPISTGLFIGGGGVDEDTDPMRGLVYLYLRYHFEKRNGFSVCSDGALVDHGGIAFIEKIMAATTQGLESLTSAAGSSYVRFPLFFTALAASGNAAAPLVQSDPRFTLNAPATDPITGQLTGIKLNDSARKDAYGSQNLLGGYEVLCDSDAAMAGAPSCSMYMTGGYSFLWTGVSAGESVKVQAPTSFNVRLSAVKVK